MFLALGFENKIFSKIYDFAAENLTVNKNSSNASANLPNAGRSHTLSPYAGHKEISCIA